MPQVVAEDARPNKVLGEEMLSLRQMAILDLL